MTEPLLAYSMSHDEKGWAWNVYDEAGEIVASGLDACQETAKAAVDRVMRHAAWLGLSGPSRRLASAGNA
ncbi:MAG: hypothetical protein ACK4TR_10475 [Phenylobacterium sp.]|uniref:hypothetical protein n=1 Tax=Phenylobacterium sp. TaxID=1871053 RepID=UPI0008D25152|nr:MAG: hypothetical protein A2882_13925 [Phenylobacterium sp. RIFCSPHIGHO2_01_FULL_70_10]